MPHRYSAPESSAQPGTLTNANGWDNRAPKSKRNTWPWENSSCGSGGRCRSIMAATSICSKSGATTANGPRLHAARFSTGPDQERHMKDPSKGHADMAKPERSIEMLLHDTRSRGCPCDEF